MAASEVRGSWDCSMVRLWMACVRPHLSRAMVFWLTQKPVNNYGLDEAIQPCLHLFRT